MSQVDVPAELAVETMRDAVDGPTGALLRKVLWSPSVSERERVSELFFVEHEVRFLQRERCKPARRALLVRQVQCFAERRFLVFVRFGFRSSFRWSDLVL